MKHLEGVHEKLSVILHGRAKQMATKTHTPQTDVGGGLPPLVDMHLVIAPSPFLLQRPTVAHISDVHIIHCMLFICHTTLMSQTVST